MEKNEIIEPLLFNKTSNIKVKNRELLKTMNYELETDTRGFIALMTVLIIFVIALIVGLSSSLLSIGEVTVGLKKTQSSQAFFLADLCAEQALMNLKEDINYSGDEIIEIEGRNCQILPIEGNWTIKVSAIFQDQIKKIKIVVSQVNPETIIESWQEVAEF